MSSIPCLGFIGRSNSGKTTLLEKLLGELGRRGYRVAVVKHTLRPDVETDFPGKDTRRLWDAGAAHTVLATPDRIVHTRRYATPPTLAEALAVVHDVDLILIEGYKQGDFPKIEVVRATLRLRCAAGAGGFHRGGGAERRMNLRWDVGKNSNTRRI
jgi:molybdopterin-guanine dinucleotide biosynthesis protein MobB